jgi:hypothetical protein
MTDKVMVHEEVLARDDQPTIELGELQLALVGGGIGDTIL